MILVVGGLNGFIGSNTTEALIDQGQNCVVTRHENAKMPGFLQKHIDQRHVIIESDYSTSIADVRKIGERHKINKIRNASGLVALSRRLNILRRGYFYMRKATCLLSR